MLLHSAPLGGTPEQASILTLAGAVGSWLGPHAEAASTGLGDVVLMAAVLGIPLAATMIRNALDKTIGQHLSDVMR